MKYNEKVVCLFLSCHQVIFLAFVPCPSDKYKRFATPDLCSLIIAYQQMRTRVLILFTSIIFVANAGIPTDQCIDC